MTLCNRLVVGLFCVATASTFTPTTDRRLFVGRYNALGSCDHLNRYVDLVTSSSRACRAFLPLSQHRYPDLKQSPAQSHQPACWPSPRHIRDGTGLPHETHLFRIPLPPPLRCELTPSCLALLLLCESLYATSWRRVASLCRPPPPLPCWPSVPCTQLARHGALQTATEYHASIAQTLAFLRCWLLCPASSPFSAASTKVGGFEN